MDDGQIAAMRTGQRPAGGGVAVAGGGQGAGQAALQVGEGRALGVQVDAGVLTLLED